MIHELGPHPLTRVLRGVGAFLLLAYGTALFATLQYATPHLVDRDGYFHARYASLAPERALARDFPFASRTFLRDRFADKELLFHVFLAPFCLRDPIAGAKLAVIVLDAAILLALYLALRAIGARFPALSGALLLASGNHFLFRMTMARPHLGAVILAIAGAAAIVAERRRAVWVIGFLFAWTYAAPHLLVGLALLDLAARCCAAGAPRDPRLLLCATGGVLMGLIVHPYFPNDLRLFFAQNGTVLAHAWGLAGERGPRLGAEFQPITTRSLVCSSAGTLATVAAGVVAAIASRERPSARTLSLFFMVLGTLFLFALSAKFVEYVAPLAVLFAASAGTDALAGRSPPRAVSAIVLAAALALHVHAAQGAREAIRTMPAPALEGAARWLDANAEPGEVVAHLSWADFSTLFFFAPRQRYLVGMDPTFMALEDPDGERAIEDMREGRRPLDGAELRRRFGARLLVVSKERAGPYEAAVRAGLEPLYDPEDDAGAVFALPETPTARQ